MKQKLILLLAVVLSMTLLLTACNNDTVEVPQAGEDSGEAATADGDGDEPAEPGDENDGETAPPSAQPNVPSGGSVDLLTDIAAFMGENWADLEVVSLFVEEEDAPGEGTVYYHVQLGVDGATEEQMSEIGDKILDSFGGEQSAYGGNIYKFTLEGAGTTIGINVD